MIALRDYYLQEGESEIEALTRVEGKRYRIGGKQTFAWLWVRACGKGKKEKPGNNNGV